jgi:hypothetical protein
MSDFQIRGLERHAAGHLTAEVIAGELRYFVDNASGSWLVWAQQRKTSQAQVRPFVTHKLEIPSLRVKLALQRKAEAFYRTNPNPLPERESVAA